MLTKEETKFKETKIGLIPEDWDIAKLKNVTSKIGSGATPTGGKSAYKEFGISLIRSQNVYNNSFSHAGLAFIDDNQADKLANITVKLEDVLLNITGDSVARVCRVPQNILPARVNQHVSIIRAQENKLYSKFLECYLSSSNGQNRLLSLASVGATRKALTKRMIEDFEIPLPTLTEQKSIAEILSAFDEKIELNCRMNKTLEEVGKTLFKRWFVDFEFPNEDGKPYKSSGGKMVDSELGEIPEGWKVTSLSHLVGVADGTHDSPKRVLEGYPLVTSKHLKDFHLDFENTYNISQSDYDEINKRSGVSRFDILLSMIGTVGLVYPVLDKSINFAIKNVGLIKTSANDRFFEYIFLFLKSKKGKEIIASSLAGSTQSYVTLGSLRAMEIIMPPHSTLGSFKSVVSPIFTSISDNIAQSEIISKSKECLLPKLISGKIRTSEALS